MKIHFNNQAFSFELLRAMSYTPYKGAEIGECLATAEKIKQGNFESWYQEWTATANRVNSIAEESLNNNHFVSAREAFLRASNYYRTAEFFLKGSDERRLSIYKKSVATFQAAMKLMDFSCEKVKIPYEDKYMHGYFYKALNHAENASQKTLIFIGGFDSTAEELYFSGAFAAIQRGYNCLTFDGPGQGEALRIQKIPTRPDYEVPVSAAIDYLLKTKPEVDPNKIALMGMSMGGYYAPRAAAIEKRIHACIVYGIFYNGWEAISSKNPKLKEAAKLPPSLMEKLVNEAMKFEPGIRWEVQNALWVFGVNHIYDIPKALSQYSLEKVADKITCPTLLLAGEADHFVPIEQLYQFREKLTCDKTVRIFTKEEGAEEHCQVGNMTLLHQVCFDWLDEKL